MVFIPLYGTDLDFDKINEERTEISNEIKQLLSNYSFDKEKKYAIIFDIDGTLLKNDKFVPLYTKTSEIFKDIKKAKLELLDQIAEIYHLCPKYNISRFLITARPIDDEVPTVKNLHIHNITNWDGLFHRPNSSYPSLEFKTSIRKQISEKYHIICNIGDQWCDLDGGFSEFIFKLPALY